MEPIDEWFQDFSKLNFVFRYAHCSLVSGSYCSAMSYIAVLWLEKTIHTYRYCFSIFTSDGRFLEASGLNLNLLIARCSLIACSYAVLLSHFVYRYLAVKTSNYTGRKFPIFMLASIILTTLFFGYGFAICFFGNSPAGKAYLRESYLKTYDVDSMELNIIAAVFDEVPDGLEYRSYASIGLLTIQSVTSLTLFITLGTMTIRSINRIKFNMSDKTKILQRQLMKALAIQTIIPIFISFSPCVLSCGISNIEVNALATFPFCDPIAIILCIPVLRRQIFFRKKMIPIQSLELNTTVVT
ncbi:unnamed protein product [Caenorhabditis nigoni]